MILGIWGRKIGMSQLFDGDSVVPVTAVKIDKWLITQIKSIDKDGYQSIQVGCVKKRYIDQAFDETWLTLKKKYFSVIREIPLDNLTDDMRVGDQLALDTVFSDGIKVDAFGKSRGKGFAGVYKKHNFGGAPKTHGSRMGKRTGSLGFMTSQGRVIKGKKMPGHLGAHQCVVQNLKLVTIDKENGVAFVKGAIPGHSGSLIFLKKSIK